MTLPASNQTASWVDMANSLFATFQVGDSEAMGTTCTERVVCGLLPDESVMVIPDSVSGDVLGGRIARTVEHMDRGAAAPLIRAISAAIWDGKASR
jgi:hypothetical protein